MQISDDTSLPPFRRLALPTPELRRIRGDERWGNIAESERDLLAVHEVARLLSARTDVVGALVTGGHLRGLRDNGRLVMTSVPRASVDEFLVRFRLTGQLAALHGVRLKVMTRRLTERGLEPLSLDLPRQPLQALWRTSDLRAAGFRAGPVARPVRGRVIRHPPRAGGAEGRARPGRQGGSRDAPQA